MTEKNTIYITGVIGEDYTYQDFLTDLQEALKDNPNSISIGIDSPGGFCADADKIVNKINQLSIPVRTFNTGDVASCASVVFMTGKTRVYDPSKGVMLIHNPWTTTEGDADELLQVVRTLRSQEKKYESIYASVTGTSQDLISEIMSQNRPLSPEEVEKYNFATVVVKDVEAKAFVRSDSKYRLAALANLKETEQINNQTKIIKSMKTLMAKIITAIKNLFLVTKDGVELTIDGDELNPGVKIYVEGVPASGSFELNDGTIITAVDGEVTEVQRVSVEEPKEENKVEEPKAEEVIIEEPVVEEPAVEEKKEEVDNAVEELKEKINELVQTVTEMKAQLQESNDKMKAQELVLQNFAKLTSTEKVSVKEDTKDNKSSRFSFKK